MECKFKNIFFKKEPLRRLTCQSGMSMMGMILAIGMVGLLFVTAGTLFRSMFKFQKANNTLVNIEQARQQLTSYLKLDSHWTATVLNNSSLDCLDPANTVDCSHDNTVPIVFFDSGNTPIFDPQNQGFTKAGEICPLTQYDCLIDLLLEVTFLCPGAVANCATPDEILIEGTFNFNRLKAINTEINFNPSRFKIEVHKIYGPTAF